MIFLDSRKYIIYKSIMHNSLITLLSFLLLRKGHKFRGIDIIIRGIDIIIL